MHQTVAAWCCPYLQGCIAEFALAALLAYAVSEGSEEMSHSASVGALVLVCHLHNIETCLCLEVQQSLVWYSCRELRALSGRL